MLRNRSRAVTKKQALMADHTSQSQSLSSPIQNYPKSTVASFFDSPRFRAFPGKALFETESVLSPTSILDPIPFSAFKNSFSGAGDGNRPKSPRNFSDNKQYSKNSDSDGIGLALISKPPYEGNVLFGANLKIQIPPLSFSISPSGSPSSGSLLNGSFNSTIITKTSSPSSSPRAAEFLSVSEMKLSEEYTCVISHGPNPKTTHIFDNCIVESFCASSDLPNPLSKSFLSFCHTCKKDLEQKNDIFIYRGEKGFCSEECRHHEMILDGLENSDFV